MLQPRFEIKRDWYLSGSPQNTHWDSWYIYFYHILYKYQECYISARSHVITVGNFLNRRHVFYSFIRHTICLKVDWDKVHLLFSQRDPPPPFFISLLAGRKQKFEVATERKSFIQRWSIAKYIIMSSNHAAIWGQRWEISEFFIDPQHKKIWVLLFPFKLRMASCQLKPEVSKWCLFFAAGMKHFCIYQSFSLYF